MKKRNPEVDEAQILGEFISFCRRMDMRFVREELESAGLVTHGGFEMIILLDDWKRIWTKYGDGVVHG